MLFVVPAPSSQASMIFAQRQIAAIKRAGVSCEVFLLASRTSISVVAGEWLRLRRLMSKFKPDVLHAQYGTMTAFFAASSSAIPLVVTYRGSDLNPSPSVPRLRSHAGKLLSQLAGLRAAQIICVSEQLRDRLWWRRGSATVIPTGVDVELFTPLRRNVARAATGWPLHERVVLFNAGGDPRVKRADLARAAVDAAEAICGDIRLVMMNGNVAPQMVPVMMSAADCMLLTSEWEGSPTVVQEAMACNLPVVSVDVGDVRSRLAAAHHSRIADRTPAALGEALADVLIRGQRSTDRSLVQHLSHSALADRIISIYREVIESRRS